MKTKYDNYKINRQECFYVVQVVNTVTNKVNYISGLSFDKEESYIMEDTNILNGLRFTLKQALNLFVCNDLKDCLKREPYCYSAVLVYPYCQGRTKMFIPSCCFWYDDINGFMWADSFDDRNAYRSLLQLHNFSPADTLAMVHYHEQLITFTSADRRLILEQQKNIDNLMSELSENMRLLLTESMSEPEKIYFALDSLNNKIKTMIGVD